MCSAAISWACFSKINLLRIDNVNNNWRVWVQNDKQKYIQLINIISCLIIMQYDWWMFVIKKVNKDCQYLKILFITILRLVEGICNQSHLKESIRCTLLKNNVVEKKNKFKIVYSFIIHWSIRRNIKSWERCSL